MVALSYMSERKRFMDLSGNYRNLVDGLFSPACVVDKKQRILYGNEEFCSLVNLDVQAFSATAGNGGGVKSDLIITSSDLSQKVFDDKRPLKSGPVQGLIQRHQQQSYQVNAIPLPGSHQVVDVVLMVFSKTVQEGGDRAASVNVSADLLRRNRELETEIIRLHDANESVARQLRKKEKELQHVKNELDNVNTEIDEELEMAKSVQASLLPRELPDVINLKTSAIYIPTEKVGGDLYDIIITPSQKIAILIFDVSGHGVPAALIAAMAKMLFAHFIEKLESPAMIFSEVNRQLCDFIQTEHYLTAFLGILDPIRNTMVYSRAGHVRPIVYHASTGSVSSLGSKGFFIGHSALRAIAEYGEDSINLSPDDKVLFYTDGLTEGTNDANELYGNKRLLDVVQKNGAMPLDDLLNVILEDQTRFRNGRELRDDFTMLCIQTESPDWLLRESGFEKEDGPSVLLVGTYRDIDLVCGVILRCMDNQGFPDNHIKHMKICIFEILMNALEHGNKRDPKKRVVVLYRITPERAMISTIDEGEGYNHSKLPNPLDPANILKDHGRGVFIVKQYMDEVSFNEKGNRILVIKYPRGGKKNGTENIL
jgi:serine phosphatase RsbU (regulator of sigma subunit)/anti-sigma regulatory factor (Ser/Thr protein kinase)